VLWQGTKISEVCTASIISVKMKTSNVIYIMTLVVPSNIEFIHVNKIMKRPPGLILDTKKKKRRRRKKKKKKKKKKIVSPLTLLISLCFLSDSLWQVIN
jgi:hypothetical protein